MRTRTTVLLAAAMMISATTSAFAADSMKHDMQRDLHARLGMTADEDMPVQSNKLTTTTYMKHDMGRDLHVSLGMAVNDDVQESVTQFNSSTNVNDQRQ